MFHPCQIAVRLGCYLKHEPCDFTPSTSKSSEPDKKNVVSVSFKRVVCRTIRSVGRSDITYRTTHETYRTLAEAQLSSLVSRIFNPAAYEISPRMDAREFQVANMIAGQRHQVG